MKACRNNNPSVAKLLLDRGCQVHVTRRTKDGGYTALHYACRDGFTECAKELLDHGADIHFPDDNMKTPLDIAKRNKHKSVIDLLLEHTSHNTDTTNQILLASDYQHEKKSILSEENVVMSDDKCNKKVEEDSREDVTKRNLQELMKTTSLLMKTTSLLSESNTTVVKCLSELSTKMEDLSSKVSRLEENAGSKEEKRTISLKRKHINEGEEEENEDCNLLNGGAADTSSDDIERRKNVRNDIGEEVPLSFLRRVKRRCTRFW